MFHRLGAFVAAHAKWVLVLSTLLIVACSVVGTGAFGRLLDEGFTNRSSGSSQAKDLLNEKFGGDTNILFLVRAHDGNVDSPQATASGKQLTTRLTSDQRLAKITSYWTTRAPALKSKDGEYALIVGQVLDDDDASAVVDDYRHFSAAPLTVAVGGEKGTDVGGQVGKDLAIAEAIAVPITLVLLVIAFGSLISALLPLAIALVAILGTFAELSLLTHVTDVSIFAINLTTAMGLGLGIDYALLIVSRFREELARGVPAHAAVARTTATAGRTVAFSALTVAAALAAMMVFPIYFLKSFAYAGIGVTAFAALSALIVLPAVLALLGHKVNSGRVPGINPNRSPEAPFWGRLASGVMRRPVVAAVPVVAVLLVMAVPLLHVTFATPDERVLPKSTATHQVGDVLRSQFAVQPNAVEVLVTPVPAPPALAAYSRELSSLSGVERVDITTSEATARLTVSTTFDSASSSAQKVVKTIRHQAAPAGTRVLVGGATAVLIDAKQAISSRLPLAAAIIVLTTLVLLFLFTGSIVQPLRALVGNALTLGATLGTMVWIFQDGHLSSVLGFTPTPINTSMPVLLFCIAFGLSMDYEVFLISRVKELHDSGVPVREATVLGLARTGRIVSTAAVLLAVSFFAFGTSNVSFIQFFGLGSGLAILLDATLVRGVLVPASMGLFGEHSWYAPRALKRFHRRFGIHEAESVSVAEGGTDNLTPPPETVSAGRTGGRS